MEPLTLSPAAQSAIEQVLADRRLGSPEALASARYRLYDGALALLPGRLVFVRDRFGHWEVDGEWDWGQAKDVVLEPHYGKGFEVRARIGYSTESFTRLEETDARLIAARLDGRVVEAEVDPWDREPDPIPEDLRLDPAPRWAAHSELEDDDDALGAEPLQAQPPIDTGPADADETDDVGYEPEDAGYESDGVGYESEDAGYESDDAGYEPDDARSEPVVEIEPDDGAAAELQAEVGGQSEVDQVEVDGQVEVGEREGEAETDGPAARFAVDESETSVKSTDGDTKTVDGTNATTSRQRGRSQAGKPSAAPQRTPRSQRERREQTSGEDLEGLYKDVRAYRSKLTARGFQWAHVIQRAGWIGAVAFGVHLLTWNLPQNALASPSVAPFLDWLAVAFVGGLFGLKEPGDAPKLLQWGLWACLARGTVHLLGAFCCAFALSYPVGQAVGWCVLSVGVFKLNGSRTLEQSIKIALGGYFVFGLIPGWIGGGYALTWAIEAAGMWAVLIAAQEWKDFPLPAPAGDAVQAG